VVKLARPILRLLAFMGRHGSMGFALSIFLGLALPQLAATLRPFLPVTIFVFVALTFARADFSGIKRSLASIALAAIGRSLAFKVRAANISGALLLVVGIGIFADVARRAIWGSEPDGGWMMAVSFIALAVNVYVLRLLNRQQSDEIHMKAAWIFTRADVVANAAVIAAGLAVQLSGIRYFDLVVGAAIGLYVVREAFEILEEAREAKRAGPP